MFISHILLYLDPKLTFEKCNFDMKSDTFLSKFLPNFFPKLPKFQDNLRVWGCGCTPSSYTYGARSQDLVMTMSSVGYSRVLDLRAEESRVVKHVKPPRYGEASSRT